MRNEILLINISTENKLLLWLSLRCMALTIRPCTDIKLALGSYLKKPVQEPLLPYP